MLLTATPARSSVIWIVLPLVLYGAASLLVFSRGMLGNEIFMPHGDTLAYIWFLNWWPHAIAHGLDPFLTDYVWSPIGFNLLWATSIPTLAILMWPVTATLGAETSWNILSLASPVLNAFAAFLLVRYLVRDRRAALLSGFIFGFSPYVTGHMIGHVSLTFVALVPLIALVGIRRAHRNIRRRWFVALLSAMVLLQFGISIEVLATTALFAGMAYGLLYVRYRHSADMTGLAVDTAIAAVICGLLLSPAFYFLWIGVEQTPDVLNSPLVFSNDLLNFIIPTRTMLMGGHLFGFLSSKFTATLSEQDAYLGLPLIACAIGACLSMRREPWAKPLAVMTLVAAVASLGPLLWIGGQTRGIPMPWAAMDYVPLIKNALPGRLALYTSLGVCIFIGAWFPTLSPRMKFLVGMVGVISIAPHPAAFSFSSYATPAVFAEAGNARKIDTFGSSLVIPFGSQGYSALWQVRSGMGFKMVGGYIGFTPRYFSLFPANGYFSGAGLPESDAEFRSNVLAFCLTNKVGSIVLGSGIKPDLLSRLRGLNWPAEVVGDSEVIRPPPAAPQEPFLKIYGDVGEAPDNDRVWLGKMTVIVNNEALPRQMMLSRSVTPGTVAPVQITVVADGSRSVHIVGAGGASVQIAAHSHIVLIAETTWMPVQHNMGSDKRRLSVFADAVAPD